MHILIVDDEPNIRRTLRTALEALGHEVGEAASIVGAVRYVERRASDLALVDLRLGTESGLDLLDALHEVRPRLVGVVITAHASLGTAVEAMRRGAVDYLPKPFTPEQVREVLERARRYVPDDARDGHGGVAALPGDEFAGSDPQVLRALAQARVVAASDAAVLVRGENGTGKGVLARALHGWSRRASGPFVTVSCPSLSAELLESDLFGHARGAFTDAVRDADGKVAAAEGGTLFLDEVGDLPAALQPKLLRFLQDRKYERVGDPVTRSADVRIVAATNRDLEAAVAAGAFRQDLLYRLNVIELTLPPVRHRTDAAEAADHLLSQHARRTGRPLEGFTPEAREAVARYPWPGNLRELSNAVERAVILAPGPLVGLADLPDRVARPSPRGEGPVEVGRRVSLDRLETEHIRRVLDATGSLDEAARVLEIDPSTLYRKRKRLGL